MTDDQTPTPEKALETTPEPTDTTPTVDAATPTAGPEAAVTPPEPATPVSPPEPAAPATPPVTAASPEAPPSTDTVAEAPPAAAAKGEFCWGTGRRKSAVARVRIRAGNGKFLINKRKIDDFFRLKKDRDAIVAPLEATESAKHVDVYVNVGGGGITGQSGAIVLGLARALCRLNGEYEQALRDGQFLTRDSRVVERKKYGQRGARRRFQFSKR